VSSGDKWDAKKVRPVAEKIVEALRPGVERIEIAGSLRRGKQLVGDIELVLVEKFIEKPSGDLFGTPKRVSALRPLLDQLIADGKLTTKLDGPAMKKYQLAKIARPLHVDVFIVQPEAWGFQLAIRTGPAWFSSKLVTPRTKQGFLNDSYLCSGGRVWQLRGELDPPADGTQPPEPYAVFDGSVYELYPVPEEADFMALQSCGMVAPDKRRYQA